MQQRYLIAEHNPHPIFMGWHLYLRESKRKNQPNADGDWGWLRYPTAFFSPVPDFMETLGGGGSNLLFVSI